jgi:hypothetical protein
MKIEFTTRRLGVIPAKAGIQNKKLNAWIPSFEGMTMDGKFLTILLELIWNLVLALYRISNASCV